MKTIYQLNLTTRTMDEFLRHSNPLHLRSDVSEDYFYLLSGTIGAPIDKFATNGTYVDFIAGGSGTDCREDIYWAASTLAPVAIFFDDLENMYITDSFCNNVRFLDRTTNRLITFAGSNIGEFGFKDDTGKNALFSFPYGGAFSATENAVLVADNLNRVIRKITKDGKVTTYSGNRTPSYRNGNRNISLFYGPTFMLSSSKSDMYLGEAGNYAIRVIRGSDCSEPRRQQCNKHSV
jgi:hypothetical protein